MLNPFQFPVPFLSICCLILEGKQRSFIQPEPIKLQSSRTRVGCNWSLVRISIRLCFTAETFRDQCKCAIAFKPDQKNIKRHLTERKCRRSTTAALLMTYPFSNILCESTSCHSRCKSAAVHPVAGPKWSCMHNCINVFSPCECQGN